MPDFYVASEHW